MIELRTTEEVINALGGNPGVTALIGAKHTSVVSNWKRLGKFPPKTYKVLKAALREHSFDAPDELWSMIDG